ncbi:hypothetical protein [Actinoplanes sp. NPDC051411]
MAVGQDRRSALIGGLASAFAASLVSVIAVLAGGVAGVVVFGLASG